MRGLRRTYVIALALALVVTGSAVAVWQLTRPEVCEPMAKQDVTVRLFYDGVWNTLEDDVYTRDGIQINHAAQSEGSGLVPSSATLTLQTRDNARLNPANPKSPLFGKIGRNTPIDISVGSSTRLSGQVASWKPRRAVKGDSWVHVIVGGILNQLGQGKDPVNDPAYRYIIRQSPHAYWPLTDGRDVDTGRPATDGTAPMGILYETDEATRRFGQGELAPWLRDGLAVVGTISTLGPVTPSDGDPATIDAVRRAERADAFAFSTIAIHDAADASGLYDYYIYLEFDGGTMAAQLFREDEAGSATALDTSSDASVQAAGWDDQPHVWRVSATQNGSDVDITGYLDGVQVLSGTHTGATMQASTDLGLLHSTTGSSRVAWGHAVFWQDTAPAAADVADAVLGHRGEKAGDRFNRLCSEEGITATVVGTASDTQPMGPQFPDTMLNLLGEIARTDNALIHDTRSALGLSMRTGRSLYNQ